MGKAIFYCFHCSTRLREDDFAIGKAVRAGDHVACADCAPQLPAAAPATKNVTSTRVPALRPTSSPAVKRPVPAEPAPANRRLLIGAGAGAAVLVLAVIVVFAMSGPTTPPPTEAPPAPAPAPRAAAESKDRTALDAARRWTQENPQDLAGQIREYQNVVFDFDRTASAAEAQKEIEKLKAVVRGHVETAAAALENELKAPIEAKDFPAARKLLEAARKRLPYPEWELAWSKKEHAVIDLSRETPAPEVKKPPPPPPVPAPAPPPSEEAKAWPARWTAAMSKAAARDHAGAAADLLKAASTLKDESIRSDAAADIADLKAVQSFLAATLDTLTKRPLGSLLTLALRDGRTAAGRILQIGPDRVELAPEGNQDSVFAEWSDVAAASLASVPRKDKPGLRILAIFCLLEGDPDSAKSLVAADPGSVAPRFWSLGAEVKVPKPDPAESSARELYYAAEREYRSMSTRGPAAEKYARLKGDFAGTALVRGVRERIQKRSEAGRDYFIPAPDFKSAGTLRMTPEGKLVSKADSDPSQTLLNFAELEFYALPSTTYRCWILAGGCCQEVFTFLWQGSDLVETNPKTKQKVPVDPGAAFASPVKIAIKGLKPAHAAKEPKSPARWEWIEIPLPRYAVPGLKKARFVTDQQGFGIAAAVVSSTRARPPAEAEVQDLEKAAASEQPSRLVDPDLIGHWTFDEGSGDEAQDSSGNGHTGRLLAGAAWTPGRLGGGLRCDGGGYVQLPRTPLLDLVQAESFTLAAWYKADVVPPGEPDANDSAHAILIKQGWHEGLVFNRESRFIMEHWIAGDAKGTGGTWADTYAPGAFHHVAAVVNRPAGKTTVFVDGHAKGTNDWSPGAATRDFGVQTWRIGIGAPGAPKWAYPAKGVIDDVRIYKRALSADEIQAIAELAR